MIAGRRHSALGRWFVLCVSLTLAARAAAGDHHSGLVWQKDKDGRPNLVWEAKSGQQVRLLDFCWNAAPVEAQPLRLAVAADPYCGCSMSSDST